MPFSARRSIAVKLPLAVAIVLLIFGAAVGVAAYLEVRQSAIDLATQRVQQAATQIAGVLAASGRQRTAAMQQLMQRPDVVRAFSADHVPGDNP